jgi:YHS domain-containing protein
MTSLETTIEDSPKKTFDPVCDMDVVPGRTTPVSVHKEHSYWFCAEACRRAFETDPDKYVKPKPVKKKGWFGKWLDRMAKSNKAVFGCTGSKCH